MPLISVCALLIWAFFLALARAGSKRPAKMPMMAITTSNSIRVKPRNGRPKREKVVIYLLFMGRGFTAGNFMHKARGKPGPTLSGQKPDRQTAARTTIRGCQAQSDQLTGSRRTGAGNLGESIITGWLSCYASCQ